MQVHARQAPQPTSFLRDPGFHLLEPNLLHSSLQQSLFVILWLAVFSRLMSVFPWQAGPRHLAHHCGLIQWLTYSRCLVNTSRWENASSLFIAGPSAGGLPCSPGCLGCSEWVGGGVAWGGRAALQGQTSCLEPHLPSPASHWSVLRVGVDLSHFLHRQPTPTPSQAGAWHPPCWHSASFGCSIKYETSGRDLFFSLFLSLCCLLPYHVEVQAWFLEIAGLSHGPSVGRKEPRLSFSCRDNSAWGCVVAMNVFFIS